MVGLQHLYASQEYPKEGFWKRMRMKTNEEYYSLKVCSICGNPLIINHFPDGVMVSCSDCDFYRFFTKETGEDVV